MLPVPLDAQALFFSLKVPNAPLRVTLPPVTGQETMTLTFGVPAATVLFDDGFHRHSAIWLAVLEVAEPPVVSDRPLVPELASVE